MSTTGAAPAAPAAPAALPKSTLPTWVQSWEALIKAHEKLIIVGILALVGVHFYSSAIAAWGRHDSKTAQQAAAVVKTDAVVTKDDTAQLAALQKQVAAQSVLIAQQIVQRNTAATQTQQAADAKLPPSDLAARWAKLLSTDPNSVHPISGTTAYQVENDAAISTVQQLEEIPTLEANNAAYILELKNDGDIITKQGVVITDLTTELTDEKKSHVADVAAQKVKTKHAFIRGLKYGFIGGFVTGFFTGHWIGY